MPNNNQEIYDNNPLQQTNGVPSVSDVFPKDYFNEEMLLHFVNSPEFSGILERNDFNEQRKSEEIDASDFSKRSLEEEKLHQVNEASEEPLTEDDFNEEILLHYVNSPEFSVLFKKDDAITQQQQQQQLQFIEHKILRNQELLNATSYTLAQNEALLQKTIVNVENLNQLQLLRQLQQQSIVASNFNDRISQDDFNGQEVSEETQGLAGFNTGLEDGSSKMHQIIVNQFTKNKKCSDRSDEGTKPNKYYPFSDKELASNNMEKLAHNKRARNLIRIKRGETPIPLTDKEKKDVSSYDLKRNTRKRFKIK